MGHITSMRSALKRQKAIDDPLLNRLGLQVWRTVAAHVAARVRRTGARSGSADHARTLRRDGCVEIPDFLAPEHFEAVRAAAERALADERVPRDALAQGANTLEVIWRSDLPPDEREALDRFFAHPEVLALGTGAERIALEPGAGRCVIQRLTQHDGEPDLEASIHSDTFHPTHKMWLYLTDVDESDGPLVYYPGSHRLSWTSLRSLYRESITTNQGSRRIPAAEIAARSSEPRVFTPQANTLVLADTFGYHGRIQGQPPGHRVALQIELRPEPFRRGKVMGEDTSVSAVTAEARRSTGAR